MLFAPSDSPLNIIALECLLELFCNVFNELLATTACRFSGGFQPTRSHGVKCSKTQILKLHTNFIHTQSSCYGCINIECFIGDAFLRFGLKRPQRSHVVQPIGQFNENDANITRHGQRHFLKVLGLFFFCAVKFYMREFTHAVDEIGDLLTKLRSYVFL